MPSNTLMRSSWGIGNSKGSPPFDKSDPYSLRLSNTSMVIGKNVLTYKELVAAMTKCYKTIEVVRGISTGTPGPRFPNANLRTDPGIAPGPGQFQPSPHLREQTRLVVTHS